VSIVDNLRIMGDALVLLNPMKKLKMEGKYQTAAPGSQTSNYNNNPDPIKQSDPNHTNLIIHNNKPEIIEEDQNNEHI